MPGSTIKPAINPAPELLDPFAIVDTPPAETQRRLAAIAVALSVSIYFEEFGHDDAPPGFDIGVTEIFDILGREMDVSVAAEFRDGRRPIDLNRLGVRMCTSCGCTDDMGCEGGCHWVGPTLCSSCAGKVPIIITGAPGSGKTTHAKALMAHYGKTALIDGGDMEWHPDHGLPPANTLVLTTWPAEGAIPIADALRDAGIVDMPR